VSKDPAVGYIGPGGATVTENEGRVFIILKPVAPIQGIRLYMQAAQDISGLALGKWRALLKERGAFHEQAAATVREGICGRSRSVG
jgi:hypothetical protein